MFVVYVSAFVINISWHESEEPLLAVSDTNAVLTDMERYRLTLYTAI
jgi:hypothetical protein